MKPGPPHGIHPPVHYVIVGNSIAGIEAAITVRNRDAAARITVVSEEYEHPFARVSLMYLFCGQLSLRDTEFHDRGLYDRMRFERVKDRVTHVDPGARTLTLTRGTLTYDRLLLAVGSRARPLECPKAYYFVTLGDYARLDAAAKPGKSAAVIGGGLIGVEVTEILHRRGLTTHFLIREPSYFPVALDERESEFVAAHIRGHGIDCRTGCPVRQVDGTEVVLSDCTLEVDVVVGAIGVVPNTDFLEGSLPLDPRTRGIEVGDDLQSVPGVWAAGDCANVTWADGSRRPEQIWYTARDQGRAAARSMLGDEVRYRRGTWYNSAKFFDLEYTTAGWIPDAADPCESWYEEARGRTLRIVTKDGIVKGFNALGSRFDHAVWLRWIRERRPLEWVLAHRDEARYDEELER